MIERLRRRNERRKPVLEDDPPLSVPHRWQWLYMRAWERAMRRRYGPVVRSTGGQQYTWVEALECDIFGKPNGFILKRWRNEMPLPRFILRHAQRWEEGRLPEWIHREGK